VQSYATSAIFNLVTTARAGGGDKGVGGRRAHGREQDEFADLLRDLKVFRFITEGAGHATAARRNDGDRMARRELEHFYRWRER